MAEEIKKSTAKKQTPEQAKQQALKAKEKEKAKLAAQKAKEKEKAKLAAQKAKEKEKAKLAAQKAKEKEKAKLSAQKTTKSSSTTKAKSSTSQVKKETPKVVKAKAQDLTTPTLDDVKTLDVKTKDLKSTDVETTKVDIVKRDINSIFESKKKVHEEVKAEDGLLADEKPTDHVAILRKKMEAQKKLKENPLSNPLDLDTNEEDNSLNEKIKKLEETISLLSDEVKQKDLVINNLDYELKDKSDQIMILTNSIVSKTNEEDLVKEIDSLKKQNAQLLQNLEEEKNKKQEENIINDNIKEETAKEEVKQSQIDINSPDIQEIIAQGDILLRIKLLNQRISEKESRIQLFEDELNKLTEEDIQAREFKKEIKSIRENRRSFIDSTNVRLQELTDLIKKDEAKLKTRKEEFEAKGLEIKEFDSKLSERKLTYSEKEKEMVVRSRLVAEYDSLGIKVNEIEEYFKKTINQYKNELASAEKKVEELNNEENNLILSNLQKLREYKTSINEDYKEDVEVRSDLLAELDKLTLIYNEMKNKEKDLEEIKAKENEKALDEMKKEYARLSGKLSLIDSRYNERISVEEVLRTIDPDVSSYLKAFEEKEKLLFDINEINNKLKETNDKTDHLDLLLNDYQERISYLDTIINKYENHEKVIFYKQLLRSIEEIKDKEAIIKAKANALKEKIDEMDNI